MEKEIKLTGLNVGAEIPAERADVEQNDTGIEQEPFDVEKILKDEKEKLGKFNITATEKFVRMYGIVSSMVIKSALDNEGAGSQKI